MSGAVDSHAHLNHPRLWHRLGEVLARAEQAGVRATVVVGYDVPSSELAVQLAQQHPQLWATVGVHPHGAAGLDERALAQLRSLASREKVVAIGEMGLDFHRNLSPPEVQREAFREQLALARELSLPAVLHCRKAQEEMLSLAAEFAGVTMVWHCFEGTEEQASRARALGMVIGFTGIITRRGGEGLGQVAAGLPADRLLIETDSPYLLPDSKRHGDNEPANVMAVAERLAAVRRTSCGEVVRVTAGNARRVFGVQDE